MADLTKQQVAELREDYALVDRLERKIADDVEQLKAAGKRIKAKLDQAAHYFPKGKSERTRHGLRFRLTTKAGRVAWRKIVESLKGKDYANHQAAIAPPVTVCTIDEKSLGL